MKILRHGDSAVLRELNKLVQFHCPTCECIFEADHTEYAQNFHYNLDNAVESGIYVTKCPDCHRPVLKEIPNEEVQAYERERAQGNS